MAGQSDSTRSISDSLVALFTQVLILTLWAIVWLTVESQTGKWAGGVTHVRYWPGVMETTIESLWLVFVLGSAPWLLWSHLAPSHTRKYATWYQIPEGVSAVMAGLAVTYLPWRWLLQHILTPLSGDDGIFSLARHAGIQAPPTFMRLAGLLAVEAAFLLTHSVYTGYLAGAPAVGARDLGRGR